MIFKRKKSEVNPDLITKITGLPLRGFFNIAVGHCEVDGSSRTLLCGTDTSVLFNCSYNIYFYKPRTRIRRKSLYGGGRGGKKA